MPAPACTESRNRRLFELRRALLDGLSEDLHAPLADLLEIAEVAADEAGEHDAVVAAEGARGAIRRCLELRIATMGALFLVRQGVELVLVAQDGFPEGIDTFFGHAPLLAEAMRDGSGESYPADGGEGSRRREGVRCFPDPGAPHAHGELLRSARARTLVIARIDVGDAAVGALVLGSGYPAT